MVIRSPLSDSARSASESHPGRPAAAGRRHYRLVDLEGTPHPVLDDLYDSVEAAWGEAIAWWREQSLQGPPPIGVEVSTSSGTWRTLRAPEG